MVENEIKKNVENAFKRDSVIAIMQSRGLTLQEFSEKSGISISSLGAWLRGFRHPKLENIRKIAECLQCRISDISSYDNPLLEEQVESIRRGNVIPPAPNIIRNSAELRECIKDAMMAHGITETAELSRLIGYNSQKWLERMLAGKLNWFPDILAAVSDVLEIKHDDLPITPYERYMLAPDGILNNGAVLVRPLPVVDWSHAADYIKNLLKGIYTVSYKWEPDTFEILSVPLGSGLGVVAFRARFQSMAPKIQDGEILFCVPIENLDDLPSNKIVVVKFSDSAKEGTGGVFCLRFRRLGETIFLTSDTSGPNFENVNPADIAWIGLVVGKYDSKF